MEERRERLQRWRKMLLLAVFIVVNLFIAVILNNLESVKAEHAAEALEGGDDAELLQRIETLRSELGDLETLLRRREPRSAP